MALNINHVPGVFPDKWFSRWKERFQEPLQATGFTADQTVEALTDDADAALARVAAPTPGEQPHWFPTGPGIALPVVPEDYHFIPLYTENAAIVFAKEDSWAGWAPQDAIPQEKLEEKLAENDRMISWEDYPAATGGVDMGMSVIATGVNTGVVPFSLLRAHNHPDVRSRQLQLTEEQQILWRTGLLWPKNREEHPLLQDFIGVLRGRSATSSRQPSVKAAQQRGKKQRRR